jgi:acetyl-CoA carboxylase biotin carboxyl carrier protein
MDLSQIQSLIKFVSKSGVNEVELETKDFKINIKTGNAEPTTAQVMMQAPAYVPQAAPAAPAPAAAAPAPAAPASTDKAPAADDSKYITIKSPMIGTFYRSPNPESDSFVNVGDEVSKGKVICIIEAMKLFNEIESEVSGRIVKVLADDASPVEYDQPLFLVDPS